MMHPEIPDLSFWEILWFSSLLVVDLGICVFFIELFSSFFRGKK